MRTAIALGAFVALLGCDNKSPDVSTTQDNICDQVAQVACFDYFQCCSEGEIETFLNLKDPPTQTQCEDDTRTRCERTRAAIDFSIENKRVKFDAKSMNACLQAFVAPDGTCAKLSDMLPWTQACMDAGFSGIVEAGSACDFDYECVKDAFCDGSRNCKALLTTGMPCLTTAQCASDLFCAPGAAPICQPKLAKGATCTTATLCAEGLYCDTQDTQTCVAFGDIGQACSGDATCTSETCLSGSCTDTGALCGSKFECSGRCSNAATTTCSADSTCNIGINGVCSGTVTACASQFNCPAGSACVFPNKCMHTECTGAVCAEQHVVVDYCQGVHGSLPFVGGNQVQGVGQTP
jgi:hypothetical protein